jgi:hypothetical protein
LPTPTPVFYEYRIKNFSDVKDRDELVFSFTDFSGRRQELSVSPQRTVTVCARQNSVVRVSGTNDFNISKFSECTVIPSTPTPTPTPTQVSSGGGGDSSEFDNVFDGIPVENIR